MTDTATVFIAFAIGLIVGKFHKEILAMTRKAIKNYQANQKKRNDALKEKKE